MRWGKVFIGVNVLGSGDTQIRGAVNMVDFKVVVSDPRTGRAYNLELSEPGSGALIGKRIGEEVSGELLGLSGYTLRLTGGTDADGFPMRPDIPGQVRRRVLVAGGVGFRPTKRGLRRRKTFRGNEISPDIVQVNMVITGWGDTPLEEMLGADEGSKSDEA